jgi:two-component system, sensor histidine kinase and response regulator
MTTILAIEDETQIRENLLEILELEGFNVLVAENGRIGLELAREHIPDLIICDVMMPEIDGYDVLVSLRQDPNTIHIPFVFLSAKSTKTDLRKGMCLGADDYLSKPFTHNDILEAISIRLEKHQQMMVRYQQEIELATSSARFTSSPQNPSNSLASPVKIIQFKGLLDVTNCHQLRQEIIEAASAGSKNVLLDCQNLTFIDSSGLAALVLASQKIDECNSRLSICSLGQQIQILFELSNLNEILEIFTSPKEFYSYYK